MHQDHAELEQRAMGDGTALSIHRPRSIVEHEAMSDKRQISLYLLRFYMAGVDFYFVEHEEEPPPTDLEIFRRDAEHTRDSAIEAGELDALRAIIDFALSHDESYLVSTFDLYLADLINSENAQDEELLRDILRFYRSVIWPEAGPVPPVEPPDIEVVKIGVDEWRRSQRAPKS